MRGLDSSVDTTRLLTRHFVGETPMYWYMDCSSQVPYLGQPVQSVGCVAKMSSMAVLRTRSAPGAAESTTMPSATSVLQAHTGSSDPSTHTMHRRQPPTASRSGCLHKCGMKMPASSAASRTVVPSSASTCWPLIVSFTLFLPCRRGFFAKSAPARPQDPTGAPSSHRMPRAHAFSIRRAWLRRSHRQCGRS